ncbi:pH-response regulator protein palA/rim20 [Kappamyces sp. JEL0680]|nr:pH-response regulator protein palA/rim20 [Kappamyces sp. JEL0680]
MFLIEHLSMDRKELEASIPSSTAASSLALKDPNLKVLKAHLDALSKNIRQRTDIAARLKKIGEKDDIGPRLAENASSSKPVDESVLFDQQIKVYNEDAALINSLLAEQEKLLELIVASNKAFMDSHKMNELIRERESALSNLDLAYKHFKDITGNLDEGIKFFSELEIVLKKFQTHCTDFVRARNIDKEQLLEKIQTGGNPSPTTPARPYNPAPLPAPGVWTPPQQASYPQGYPPQGFQNPGTWNQSQQPPQWNQYPPQNYPQHGHSPSPGPQQPSYPHQQLPGTWQPSQPPLPPRK